MLDLRSQQEKDDSIRAQRPLDRGDEAYAAKLCVLLAKLDSDRAVAYPEIRRIGEEINRTGGFPRMQLVHERVASLGGRARTIEAIWDGIGEWLG